METTSNWTIERTVHVHACVYVCTCNEQCNENDVDDKIQSCVKKSSFSFENLNL